ncbi:MAG TPA: flagellar basal body-associated FliL family protein [Phycisphaerae bacterium]|nr:flagellar basal body-associated FliL family protein [Phycisphaerae bacterium]HRY69756.1 flagellar basal body-associated FliL family protein [Phycisphaerae bacterium]HSA29232.1 flagellar basal body-associated FliL family protein [Phycisphaerae bacterium]
MAKDKEEASKKPSEDAAGGDKPKKGRGKLIMIGVIAGVMIAEAAVVFVLVKSFSGGGPQEAEAHATEGLKDGEGAQPAAAQLDLEVVKFRAQNEKSQRLLMYELSVSAVVSGDSEAEVKEILERRKETIRDRFTRVVRSADPSRFMEPDLATLRDQFKAELSQVIGKEGAIQEVLIPQIVLMSGG